MAKKCDNCLRGAVPSITGIEHRTLELDMRGARLYVIPQANGEIDVCLNSENLTDGDYLSAGWNGERWIVTTREGRDI